MAPAKKDEIIVIGRDRQAVDRQIRDFVGAMTPAKGIDPLARMDVDRLCPRVAGTGAETDRAIENRLRQVASAIGVKVDSEDCAVPNAVVLFVSDKAATIEWMRKRRWWLFRSYNGGRIRIDEEGPAAAWHVDGRTTRDGRPMSLDLWSYTTLPASRLQAMARPVFLTSIVVIEAKEATGLTAIQLADYAAMRTLTDARPAAAQAAGLPTILTVLDAPLGAATPRSMTSWDLGFLRGLYAAPPNSFAPSQRSAIKNYVRQEVVKSADGK